MSKSLSKPEKSYRSSTDATRFVTLPRLFGILDRDTPEEKSSSRWKAIASGNVAITLRHTTHYEGAKMAEAFAELKRGVQAALETYSNVHRGSGHNSMVSTQLYEQARQIVLEYLGLNPGKYVVIFCTPRRAEMLKAQLKPTSCKSVSSQDRGRASSVAVFSSQQLKAPGLLPTLTTPPAPPHSRRYGTLSARPGASPARCSKRSFMRSKPSAPGCWGRLWQPMM